jgi:hypothetical protein
MNKAEEKILALFTYTTERLGDIARLADMTEAGTLDALRELRRRGLVMSPHVDQEPDETLWRKV